jgi:hypothetical protein
VAVIVLLIVVTLASAQSDFAGVLAAIGAAWLAVHQVEFRIDEASLGFLPMAPTLAVLALTMVHCRSAAMPGGHREAEDDSRPAAANSRPESRNDTTWALSIAAAALVAPLIVTTLAIAAVYDSAETLEISVPNVIEAYFGPFAVHGIAAAAGIGLPLWRRIVAKLPVPDWIWSAAACAWRAGLALLAAATAVAGVLVVVSLGALSDDLAQYDVVGALAILVVSLLYVPNLIVGAAAVLVGADVGVGNASYSLVRVTASDLPQVPIIGSLPGTSAPWWLVLFAFPILAGVILGRRAHAAHGDSRRRFATAALAAAMVAVLVGLAALGAGGQLGAYGPVDMAPVTAGWLTFLWLGGVGAATIALLNWRGGKQLKHQRRAEVERAIAEAKAEQLAAAQATPAQAESASEQAADSAAVAARESRAGKVGAGLRGAAAKVRGRGKAMPAPAAAAPARAEQASKQQTSKDQAPQGQAPEKQAPEKQAPEKQAPEKRELKDQPAKVTAAKEQPPKAQAPNPQAPAVAPKKEAAEEPSPDSAQPDSSAVREDDPKAPSARPAGSRAAGGRRTRGTAPRTK